MADWAKIDVGFLRHPQVIVLKPLEQLRYLSLILYAQEYETDGVIPDAALAVCGVKTSDVKAMERACLLVRNDGAWCIDGFTRKQRSAAELESERIKARDRKQRWREANR
jgi:hypothetical protein